MSAFAAAESPLPPTTPVPAPAGVESAFDFPEGLLGFPEARRFVLTSGRRDGLYWLQSLDHEALAFLLCDPFVFFDAFEVELGSRELPVGFGRSRTDLAVLSIVTLPREAGAPATANLQGPVLFDFASGQARQVALAESPWGVRCPVDLRASANGPRNVPTQPNPRRTT